VLRPGNGEPWPGLEYKQDDEDNEQKGKKYLEHGDHDSEVK
jgi:hypothetical protein